ncbi:synaptopodin 2-like protein [Chanos chanos]|uniref:Synaptopodin 2-like protein n=1 Tax=Chanos chanos TaxID=29144 RepID=A0A6J2URW0_CHACN|nr:synaptopodin [Chanos chanos]
MERGHEPVRRGVSWTGPGATATTSLSRASGGKFLMEANSRLGSIERSSTNVWEKDDQSWVKGKSGLTSKTSPEGRKTNLSRSASLSEKELKEARTRSQIIAAQLTVPTNSNSRGVQLFNRRKQRVNAFTLVSFGEGGREDAPKNEKESSPQSELTWEKTHLTDIKERDLNNKNSQTKLPWSSVNLHSIGGTMEDRGEAVREVEDIDDSAQERCFVPVNEKDEELSDALVDPVKDEITLRDDSTAAVIGSACQEKVEINGGYSTSVNAHGEIPNGCHSAQTDGKVAKTVAKQTAIINRTARPFFSPTTVCSTGATSPEMDTPPTPSYSTPPIPDFQNSPPIAYSEPPPSNYTDPSASAPSRLTFSPPPPPSYPTPPLPSYTSPSPPAISSPPPGASAMPSSLSPYCVPPTAPRPTFVPQLLNEKRSLTPSRTGILDEGRARRATRKSMFTFQEKPKVDPNPELLSLVQGVDEKKKVKAQPEPAQEEELLALGAEASNFLAKDEASPEEAMVPEWASCLKSSRTQVRMQHKPEQALTNASGKGAELFAKRQSRMEKYVLDSAASEQIRSPSPTMSLPPSWVYPSNMPGRVKAIANSSNISMQISRTLQAQQPTHKKNVPTKAPAPAPVPETPALENGCTKIEMELSKHQPYQLNSALFILNPAKDPVSTLPRAAPPPKPVMTGHLYSRQTSLPSSPSGTFNSSSAYRSAHCFSPPMMPLSPVSDIIPPTSAISPERVASPRSVVQAPKPTFSATKAGIEPQIKEERPATPITSRTPNTTRRFSSPDGPSRAVWSPNSNSTRVSSPRALPKSMAISPVSPPWETSCQSPTTIQDVKANHRLLAKNIINAAKRKNSPSPGALSGHSLPMSPVGSGPLPYEHKPVSPFQPRLLGSQSPTFTSPPPTPTRLVRSPVRLYNTRSLTDSDASVESEDSGLRSTGLRTYNTCPRGWSGSLKIKRGSIPADL